jgi:hypothetical protein
MRTIIELSADLSSALTAQDDAFAHHDNARYVDAATKADHLRAELAAEPAKDIRGLSLKLRSLGAMPVTGLASLSRGEALLLASVIADARRLLLPRSPVTWPLATAAA